MGECWYSVYEPNNLHCCHCVWMEERYRYSVRRSIFTVILQANRILPFSESARGGLGRLTQSVSTTQFFLSFLTNFLDFFSFLFLCCNKRDSSCNVVGLFCDSDWFGLIVCGCVSLMKGSEWFKENESAALLKKGQWFKVMNQLLYSGCTWHRRNSVKNHLKCWQLVQVSVATLFLCSCHNQVVSDHTGSHRLLAICASSCSWLAVR